MHEVRSAQRSRHDSEAFLHTFFAGKKYGLRSEHHTRRYRGTLIPTPFVPAGHFPLTGGIGLKEKALACISPEFVVG